MTLLPPSAPRIFPSLVCAHHCLSALVNTPLVAVEHLLLILGEGKLFAQPFVVRNGLVSRSVSLEREGAECQFTSAGDDRQGQAASIMDAFVNKRLFPQLFSKDTVCVTEFIMRLFQGRRLFTERVSRPCAGGERERTAAMNK